MMLQILLLILLVGMPNLAEGEIFTDLSYIWNGIITFLGQIKDVFLENFNMMRFESPENKKIKEEMFYTMFDFTSINGYPLESHYITTKDGYILEIFRIRQNDNSNQSNGIILLQHGLGCSSEMWISNGKNNSLGFHLADLKYDVWMGNFRGNLYSRNHTTLNPDYNYEFWEFSSDQHGSHDLPAMIDFILNMTRQPKLMFIGHSMGNEVCLTMLSSRPEYNNKLNGFIALAGSVTPSTYGLPIVKLLTLNSEFIRKIMLLVTETGITWEVGHRTKIFSMIYLLLCHPDHRQLCQYAFDVMFGVMVDELFDMNRLPIFLNQIRSGGSYRQAFYLEQISINKNYSKYDFGPNENKIIYRDFQPPLYNFSNVITPTIVFCANNDVFASPLNSAYLMARLPNLIKSVEIAHPMYTHLSYFTSKRNHILLFPLVEEAISTLLSLNHTK